MKKLILTIAAILSMATMSYALPALQLDIAGGTYVGGSDATTYANSNIFNLYALADVGKFTNDTYYLSMALTPASTTPVSGGSFTISTPIGTQTINVTSGMTYGTPPIERLLGGIATTDPCDLASHSVFPTYFTDFAFTFDTTKQIKAYDVQAGNMGLTPTAGTGLYYQMFAIDTTNLSSLYQIHFDLYSEKLAKSSTTDLDINTFAPFSHDASSGPPPVPEPGTIVLLGFGILGLVVAGKRRMNK